MGGGAALAVLAAAPLLALAGVPQDQKVDLRMPGTFQHGQWQGRCFRDGYLSGMDHELCRGWTNGPVSMWFERTAEDMRFWLTVKGFTRQTGSQVEMQASSLEDSHRAENIAAVLRRVLPMSLSACHSKHAAPVVDVAALAEVLTETDGLEAGSMR